MGNFGLKILNLSDGSLRPDGSGSGMGGGGYKYRPAPNKHHGPIGKTRANAQK